MGSPMNPILSGPPDAEHGAPARKHAQSCQLLDFDPGLLIFFFFLHPEHKSGMFPKSRKLQQAIYIN